MDAEEYVCWKYKCCVYGKAQEICKWKTVVDVEYEFTDLKIQYFGFMGNSFK